MPIAEITLETLFEEACDQGLDLDLTRGKPSSAQLDLSAPLLEGFGDDGVRSREGLDCRNYGGVEGLQEVREIYAPLLGVEAEELVVGDNASLSLMHDVIAQALLRGVVGGDGPWRDCHPPRFLCPVPGYDRHFSICEYLGVEMLPVPMTDDGPDLDVVRKLVATDDSVKGIFCVPRYSNPTGITYSDEVVRGLARLRTAAPDFRIIWDNAYAVHHLYPDPQPLLGILDECRVAGCPHRPLLFASTSKITFAGAGLSLVGADEANLADLRLWRAKQSIGPDKLNQLRHARFLPSFEAVEDHMSKHADILRPKFEAVLAILEQDLGDLGVATWSRPRGGYFIALDLPDGCARAVVERARRAGVRLTPAGATFPYGRDPRDRNLRLAPSFPPLEELVEATRVLTLAIRLEASANGLL